MDLIKHIKQLEAQQKEQERTKEQVKNLLGFLGFVLVICFCMIAEEALNMGI